MKRASEKWLIVYAVIQVLLIAAVIVTVVVIDPFFHYHKPVEGLFYPLGSSSDSRSLNDGIVKHFDYNALITGSSMTECFKTSEADDIFDADFIKVAYPGGTYYETGVLIRTALANNEQIKMIVRGVDLGGIFYNKDAIREDMGEYPLYLFNDNYFDDVEYIFNKDILGRCYKMIKLKAAGTPGGRTSFDEYSNWMKYYTFGKDIVLSKSVFARSGGWQGDAPAKQITENEIAGVRESVIQNIVDIANDYPDVEFYVFFPPYSVVAYGDWRMDGNFDRFLAAEELAIDLMLDCKNIKLFSFDTFTDISSNLDNYRDPHHYGEWINSLMLQYMRDGAGLLTRDNYLEYVQAKREYFSSFDYESLYGNG